jgi:hypothetical protein
LEYNKIACVPSNQQIKESLLFFHIARHFWLLFHKFVRLRRNFSFYAAQIFLARHNPQNLREKEPNTCDKQHFSRTANAQIFHKHDGGNDVSYRSEVPTSLKT